MPMTHWTDEMIRQLQDGYATKFNRDLAIEIGVSLRTLIRKARALGLKKEPGFLAKNFDEIERRAAIASRKVGRAYLKGIRTNPAGEFKPGHKESADTKAKRIASLKERAYRDKVRLKYGLKPTTKWPVKDTL